VSLLHLLDLRPINDIASANKDDLPVAVSLLPDGAPIVVSRFGDYVWDFYPYIPQENLPPAEKQVDWRIALPDGRLLTDPEHAGLLRATKEFIWSLFADPVEGRARPTMLTLCRKVNDSKLLLRWMVRLGLKRFAELAGLTLDYVPVAKLGEEGRPAASVTVTLRLAIVEDIYHQRDKLNDALLVHPWPHESSVSLAGLTRDAAHRKPKTEFIPDAVVYRLSKAALDYVQNRSSDILTELAGYRCSAELTTEAIWLRTACYIVINLFSGIRSSEMMSLAENCIAPCKSRDGSTDILWLHGTIYKTGVRPKRWLVPPIVEEAVRVLTRLTAPLRRELEREECEIQERLVLAIAQERTRLVKRLDIVRKHKTKLFLAIKRNKGNEASVLSSTAMRGDLKRFCITSDIRGDDGQPYLLHPHQFRRTYARFIARSQLGDLLTLRDHFGHWSIDMTVYYADGGADGYETDAELLEMVVLEKGDRQSEILGGYLNSDAPLANGGHWLKDWRASVRTAANKEALIKEYAGTITLNGTGHSWCVGNVRGAGCGGLCVFEAQMCVECNYGIIGEEHRPVWDGIREQQREALELDDMGPGGRARAQTILRYAEKVLLRLDGQESA
jgi:integrase